MVVLSRLVESVVPNIDALGVVVAAAGLIGVVAASAIEAVAVEPSC